MSEIISGRYVVGMAWRPIVAGAGGSPAALARRRARADKGNWYSHADRQTQVGIATLPKRLKVGKGKGLQAAGRLAGARASLNTAFFALSLDEAGLAGQAWICGVAKHLPVNGFDAVVPVEEVRAQLDAFLERQQASAEEVVVYGDLADYVPVNEPASWASDIASSRHEDATTALRPVTGGMLDGLSEGKRMLVYAGVLGLVGVVAWDQYSQASRARAVAQARAMQADPTTEWNVAMLRWAAAQGGHGADALSALRAAVGALPTSVANWALATVECAKGIDAWVCKATFDRTKRLKLDPVSSGFYAQRPASWTVVSKSMDTIEASFRVPVNSKPLTLDAIQPLAWHELNTISALQRASRAFGQVTVDPFRSALDPTLAGRMEAPRGPDGTAMAMPPGMHEPVVSTISLTGPMRSLDLGEIRRLDVSWHSFTFNFGTRAAKPSLTASSITVAAQGNLYAKR